MKTGNRIEPLTISVEDAYRALGIGRTAFYAMVKRGEIKLIKIGRRSLVPCSELTGLIETKLLNHGKANAD